jgi:hypothetical protein
MFSGADNGRGCTAPVRFFSESKQARAPARTLVGTAVLSTPLYLYVTTATPNALFVFVWLITHQPPVLFSQNKPATSNQSAVLFSQNKPAPTITHQPNEQTEIPYRVVGPYPDELGKITHQISYPRRSLLYTSRRRPPGLRLSASPLP